MPKSSSQTHSFWTLSIGVRTQVLHPLVDFSNSSSCCSSGPNSLSSHLRLFTFSLLSLSQFHYYISPSLYPCHPSYSLEDAALDYFLVFFSHFPGLQLWCLSIWDFWSQWFLKFSLVSQCFISELYELGPWAPLTSQLSPSLLLPLPGLEIPSVVCFLPSSSNSSTHDNDQKVKYHWRAASNIA